MERGAVAEQESRQQSDIWEDVLQKWIDNEKDES